ncbi:MAG: glycosyltransferase family 4 protein [Flavobacteriales bacterium]|nr:glycosyltransferase family 4 protein [Flavobacteriales bacterium]
MKLLIITQYFPPEVGAAQSRLYELAIRLKAKGAQITILTALPNYPVMEIHEGYRGKIFFTEDMDGLKVMRSWIYVSKGTGMLSRMMNYLSFTFTSMVFGLFSAGKQDIIFCESPPIFLGASSLFLSLAKGANMVFNVSDLWPESAVKLGVVKNPLAISMATWLEELCYRNSALITGQTKGITDHIAERFPNKKTYWLRNGSNSDLFNHELDKSWRAENDFDEEDFILLYAGIIGLAQGLEVILEAAAQQQQWFNMKFLIIGGGPEKEKLVQLSEEMELKHLRFMDVQPRSAMPAILAACNAVIIPLKKLPLFEGAIPSKIYESTMMGKPLLLGVEGEAKTFFIDDAKAGLAFEPENGEDLAKQIDRLYEDRALAKELGDNGRAYVNANFSLDNIADGLWIELNRLNN